MIKNIRYNGYTAQPSDYDAPDGDLAVALNLINENNSLHPTKLPVARFNVGADRRVFLHRVGANTNYIAYQPAAGSLAWIGTEADGKFTNERSIETAGSIGKIIDITSVGYIIIVSTDQNIYYIRYNAVKDAYIFLGNKIPDVRINFGLKLNFTLADKQCTEFEPKEKTDNETDNTTTGDDTWKPYFILYYDLAYNNGDYSRDNVRLESMKDKMVATAMIPMDEVYTFKPNIEYKLRWEILWGAYQGMTLSIYGSRNGSEDLELITSLTCEKSTCYTIEKTKEFTDNWTNLHYYISILYYNDSWSAEEEANMLSYIRTVARLSVLKGVDESDSGLTDVDYYLEYTEDSHNAIMGAVNKFVYNGHKKSRFIYPFLLRYGVQLYDGSYAVISNPILMLPNSDYAPAVAFTTHFKLGTRIVLSAYLADIKYQLTKQIPDDWEDLISGVDVFVSDPIWFYNQGQEYDGTKNYFVFKNCIESCGFGKLYLDDAPADSLEFHMNSLQDSTERFGEPFKRFVQIAPRSADDIRRDIETVANFYRIASIDVQELNNAVKDFADLKVEEGILTNLVTRPLLDDDILQYNGYRNAYIKAYNNRLHVCHSSYGLPLPAHPAECFNYLTPNAGGDLIIRTYVFLATEDGKKMVKRVNAGTATGPWFFYPDSRANKVAFVLCRFGKLSTVVLGIAEYDLVKHDYLNGSYVYCGSLLSQFDFQPANIDPYESVAIDSYVDALNEIFVSEANCPFAFRASSAVSVGAQEVFAISCANRALSDGQFGQFPLYAFSSEGIWAISVGANGVYSAVQPISRDELINVNSVTQIDDAVLFVTHRGVMMISGSQTSCISNIVNSDYGFDLNALPKFNRIADIADISSETLSTIPFNAFLAGGRMMYDYPNQRIILYNPACRYAYTLSLISHNWSMIESNIVSNVNSYPEALAVDSVGNLVDFSTRSPDYRPAILITRPLKLDGPDILKTIDTVIQRGNFAKGHVASVLYGSRDLAHWHLVWSSQSHIMRGFSGTPYKYFRIALICNLDPDESISGASIQFTPRYGNKLR